MKQVVRYAVRFLKKEEGVTAVECALMLALIVVICVVAINQVDPTSPISGPIVVDVSDR